MNANKYFEAKKALREELGENYPKSKEELSFKFLLNFSNFLDGANEDVFGDDYEAYETALYSSEQMAFIDKIAYLAVKENQGDEDYEEAKNSFIDWVVENYFPEFAIFNDNRPGIIHAHTEDLPFFDKSKETTIYNEKIEGMRGIMVLGVMTSELFLSETPVDITLDASWYLNSFENLMLLSYNLNNYIDDDGNGWMVRNGELFFVRSEQLKEELKEAYGMVF